MKRFTVLILTVVTSFVYSCCSNDDDDESTVIPGGDKSIQLALTSRVGTVIDDDLTNYVQSLNLMAFRKNRQGEYVLYQTKALTLADLKALENSGESVSPGFTTKRNVTIDQLPVGTYQVVGLSNALDLQGNVLPSVSLDGLVIGKTMAQVIASVSDGNESPRFFFGTTAPIVLGAAVTGIPTLILNRKISMFVLTLKDVPQVVTKINLETKNTYGAFDMTGQFLSSPVISVNDSSTYSFTSVQDSVLIASVTLPTANPAFSRSSFVVTFTLDNGQVISLPLPQYMLRENTITKLTATVNAESPGGQWNFNLTFDITVNVEWNVDQEPPITI